MGDGLNKLAAMQEANANMAYKLFKFTGWGIVILGVPLLIFPPVGLSCFAIGALVIWGAKKMLPMGSVAAEVLRDMAANQNKTKDS
ncbi:MAG: hypothetical protein V4495_14125 [Pseudomonadota bacterium]